MSEIQVGQLAERQRYALFDGEKIIGAAHYRDLSTDHGIERVFFHTVVDEAFSGQGLASKLAAFALEDTIAQGHKVVAVCPYIKAYTAKHHQYDAQLVTPGSQHLRILPTA
ncbi:GNAT family N-acetyltransferase [Paeniglutamicibacter kerguelensis]|uniref:GNAT family acetyltransferase n=1 Tax=Paeniglutamicibacter kerguelensis TaxID=254788 RepID=A0ABS4XI93_9MICC|nr:GNAT family N-acetyltransferase [Paeniglutamicibacter kerguelensis]MBP2388150.1 putative GNAT family acetyltransferase [Paeniglutamicibacter kerguelensis]